MGVGLYIILYNVSKWATYNVTYMHVCVSMQGYFIIPVAIFVSISSILVIILPIVQEPAPALIAVGIALLGLPAYAFFIMKTPWRLKPKLFSSKLATAWYKIMILVYA